MKVTCSGCARGLNVPDKLIGRTITCPACKASIKVEESLELAPEAPQPAAGPMAAPDMKRAPSAGTGPGMCPGCGFPIPANKQICNRCGYNRDTGEQDESFIGYQAGFWQQYSGMTYKLVSAIVGLLVVGGIIYAVMSAGSWTEKIAEEEKQKAVTKAEKKKPKKAAPKKVAAPIPPPAAPSARDAKAPPPETDMTEVFEEAFALLTDPVPATSQEGERRIIQIGPVAIPLLYQRTKETEDAGIRTVCIKAMARFRSPDAVANLIELLGDKEPRVRDEASQALVTQGKSVSNQIGPALVADQMWARVGAIHVVRSLRLVEHTSDVIKLLNDVDPEVRQAAAVALGGSLAGPLVHGPLIEALDDDSTDVAMAAAEALSKQSGAIGRVADALKLVPGGNEDARFVKLFYLSWPILAIGDPATSEQLTKAICSEKPIPDVVRFCQKILASGNSIVSRDAVMQAASEKKYSPPESIAALCCLVSADSRLRGAAREYAASMPAVTFSLPLIAGMGFDDTSHAVECARVLWEKADDEVTAALKRTVKGVNFQRKTLAAIALARLGDDTGAENLKRVALGTVPLPSPIPGLAAFAYARLRKGELTNVFFQKYRASAIPVDRLYYCAAAASAGHEDAVAGLRGMLKDRQLGTIRFEAAELLGEMGDVESRDGLIALLGSGDELAQAAAVRALARLGGDDVVTVLLKQAPWLRRTPAAEARKVIVALGNKATLQLKAALEDEDPRVQTAALEVISDLGRNTPRELIQNLGMLLQNIALPARAQEEVKRATVAATGARPQPDWTWRNWVEACGLTPGELVKKLELERHQWRWVSLEVPTKWERNDVACGGDTMPGAPMITIIQEFEIDAVNKVKGFWTAKHSDLKEFEKNRINGLARQEVASGKWEPRPDCTVKNGPSFSAGGKQAASFLVVDGQRGRTTYYVLVWMKANQSIAYIEVAFSADTSDYQDYSDLFEKRIARSMRIVKPADEQK
jgi:HEAT repeat protein